MPWLLAMGGPLRRLIALAGVLGGLVVFAALAAAPASAALTQCGSSFYPQFPSTDWQVLNHQNLSCEHAKDRA
jgi:hypothetical protein